MDILTLALALVSVAAVSSVPVTIWVVLRHMERTQTVGGHAVSVLKADRELHEKTAERNLALALAKKARMAAMTANQNAMGG